MNWSLSPYERFQLKLQPQENGCIECEGAVSKGGYIFFWYSGQNRYAHRMAWFFEHGPIPEGKIVLHTCDNRRCVNLEHLKLGTHQENTDDMFTKGRDAAAAGTHNPNNKITEETARKIRQELLDGNEHHTEIARRYNTTRSTVRNIDRGLAWRWLDGSNDKQL
jgi:hypothetical protein